MSKFSKVKISDIGQTITGKTPSSNDPEDFGSEFMFVTPSDSFDKKMMNFTERYLSVEGVEKLSNKLLPPKSIMVTCIGSAMGKVAMNETSCITNQQINSIVPNKRYDSDYIFYAIKNNYKVLRNAATGSTALPLLNKTDFDILELPIHEDKTYQQKVSSVLSPIDAKIELNNRINRELEAMAKALYDYWFVQFDFPVASSASATGEAYPEPVEGYKSSGGKMVYNAELKREIPEGWEVKKLNDTLRIVRGASPRPIDDYMAESGFPWIKISDATAINHWFIIGTKEYIKEEGVKSSRELQPGTLILSNSASPGIPKIVQIRACVHDGWLIVDSYKNGLYNEFMLFYFENFRSKIINMGSGSIFKNLKTEYIKDLNIAIPPIHLLEKSKVAFDNIYKQVLTNAIQNQQLSELRDWLLPMLMNGQVTVRQAHGNAVKEAEERLSSSTELSRSMAAEPSVEYKTKGNG